MTKTEAEVLLASLADLRLDLHELERLGCLCDCLHGVACPIHAEASRAEERLNELEQRLHEFAQREQRRDPTAHEHDL